ncbi:hypothetical protein GGX14DRAFT_167821 [Mycena pura]|uniref:TEA domain-containing protein n=1 Tax=Mycena pura TaxID=153505 RepID=A0AAD6V2Z3_9AGAR|nr:hypothetical protein GGX14DRAFT_167821 [Mycena pura]
MPVHTPVPARSPALDESRSLPEREVSKSIQRLLQDKRKLWKTFDSGGAVWPPELEGALLEGLAAYQPTECRETLQLGRYPKRNRFVSEYIWKKTGEQRTPKQVGSRIQQLRESCQPEDQELLQDLLFPAPKPMPAERASPVSPQEPDLTDSSEMVILIDVVPPSGRTVRQPPDAELCQCQCQWSGSGNALQVSRHPRLLQCIDPTVTFVSRCRIVGATSKFTVRTGTDAARIVHSESGPLLLAHADLGPQGDRNPSSILYRASLVPGFWKIIVDSSDPARYTIFHQVIAVDGAIIFAATYKFRYPASVQPSSP